ncbi:hypothetical protein BDA99DRAFT_533902 [Phascolomyces articulosus]|uniref:Uncharacterized protein n=1 Tax=Phascolomyces articulosus TaxID=60185 RepID=A0AAD5PJK8_9FUNG|nr:hypothetical protein BDA99DRAFT_533902 [Phascolomyces articulosus]
MDLITSYLAPFSSPLFNSPTIRTRWPNTKLDNLGVSYTTLCRPDCLISNMTGMKCTYSRVFGEVKSAANEHDGHLLAKDNLRLKILAKMPSMWACWGVSFYIKQWELPDLLSNLNGLKSIMMAHEKCVPNTDQYMEPKGWDEYEYNTLLDTICNFPIRLVVLLPLICIKPHSVHWGNRKPSE